VVSPFHCNNRRFARHLNGACERAPCLFARDFSVPLGVAAARSVRLEMWGAYRIFAVDGGMWRSRIRVLVANSLGPTEARSQQARRADATSGRRGGAHRRFGPVDDLYTERANGTDDQ